MKKVKVEINGEIISYWDGLEMSDPKQITPYDRFLKAVTDFNAEITIARHSSDSLDRSDEIGYKKSLFALETEGMDIQDRVPLIAIEIFKESQGMKRNITPKEIKERFFQEYNNELNNSTLRKGLLRWEKYFIHNGKVRNSSYRFNLNIEDVNSVATELTSQ